MADRCEAVRVCVCARVLVNVFLRVRACMWIRITMYKSINVYPGMTRMVCSTATKLWAASCGMRAATAE